MKIGSPKNLEGKNLLVGVSAVDSNDASYAGAFQPAMCI